MALGWHVIEFAETSAILEFYFRFRFRPYRCSRHVILHQSAKFYPNPTAHGRKMMSCLFSRWRISAILDFMGPIMYFLKSPCTTSYRHVIYISFYVKVIPWVGKIKYLGVYFLCNTGLTDITDSTSKFYGKFNIMSTLGNGSCEITALHLRKTYCLPSLLYDCEVWHLTDTNMHKIFVAWNNSFRRIFTAQCYA